MRRSCTVEYCRVMYSTVRYCTVEYCRVPNVTCDSYGTSRGASDCLQDIISIQARHRYRTVPVQYDYSTKPTYAREPNRSGALYSTVSTKLRVEHITCVISTLVIIVEKRRCERPKSKRNS